MAEAAAQIALGKRQDMEVGDLELTRDWGNAEDGVECMWLCLQQETPRDYLLATGVGHTVRQFLEATFKALHIVLE